MRVNAFVVDNTIAEIMITGDYLMHPVEAITALEAKLKGVKTDEKSIRQAVEAFYKETAVNTPGAGADDYIAAIMKALNPPTS
jgi:hypothetical protein